MADDREVAARALCDSINGTNEVWDQISTAVQDLYRQHADAVLAALAGRIAPEVEGDVVEAAAVIIAKEHGHCGQFLASQVANAVAAATERRVLDIAAGWIAQRYGQSVTTTWSTAMRRAVSAAIRTGAAS